MAATVAVVTEQFAWWHRFTEAWNVTLFIWIKVYIYINKFVLFFSSELEKWPHVRENLSSYSNDLLGFRILCFSRYRVKYLKKKRRDPTNSFSSKTCFNLYFSSFYTIFYLFFFSLHVSFAEMFKKKKIITSKQMASHIRFDSRD